MSRGCPFCDLAGRDLSAESALAVAFRDAYPVNPGHTLLVPRRHVATWFDATGDEQRAILDLLDRVKAQLDTELAPHGYNVGFNAGPAAGQTVPHLHVHLIPRFDGDVDDPTGGVRLVIPARGNYRRPGFVPSSGGGSPAAGGHGAGRGARPAPLATGWHDDPFLPHLVPLFARADDIAILAAFVQDTGVYRLEPYLTSAVERGARVRLVTGDYLNITQAHALRHLLDLSRGAGLRDGEPPGRPGSLEVRVVEVDRIEPAASSFHPKSWIFLGPGLGSAFVGSSNLSRAALSDGVEWNLRVDRGRDPDAFARVVAAYESWWQRARVLDEAWVDAYDARAHAAQRIEAPGEVEPEEEPPPTPRDVQKEALRALRRDRAQGRSRALVVFATGLGKTWLAAFDAKQMEEELGRPVRVLFLAHRVEILRQAAGTFRRLFPDRRFGWYVADGNGLDAGVVLASVQKLARRENLQRVEPDAFDYVVVDEVHHADAATYRRILEHLQPRFLLGLTATPERADAGDIFGLFDDHVAARADIGDGIVLGHLVPFRYRGLKDTVDYAPIPWRSGRFDPEALAAAVETRARMEKLWEAWGAHPGTRTLVFCCSIQHARFVEGWLRERGVAAAAVHSEPDSADRAEALWKLSANELEAVCAVDLFNEGVDLPAVDRVVMLRPTESPVLFLQQLGRGLRMAEGKEYLQVIDFVGNHRVFLDRVRTLLSLAPAFRPADLHAFLRSGAPPELPTGCAVEIELEAIDLLRRLVSDGGRTALVRAYRELRGSRGVRPSIGELFRMGLNPRTLKGFHGWFDFVASEGDLAEDERLALEHAGEWLRAVEVRETMNRSYKMVALEALLDAGALEAGTTVAENARRAYEIMRRSPELFADLQGTRELPDPTHVAEAEWTAYWAKWPLAHWAGAGRRKGEKAWFRLEGERFEPTFAVPAEAADALARMTREIVDYRLARYRRTKRQEAAAERGAFEAKVISNRRDPILILPDRAKMPGIPRGDTDVRLEDGAYWRFRFVKVAVNVAHPVGSSRNELPDLLRSWFGPDAGKPGTAFAVRFTPSPDGWSAEPVARAGARVVPFPERGRLVAFPTLRAAAGWHEQARTGDAVEADEVALPGDFDREKCFAVRASGTSMEGWKTEIRDGDWLVMCWARGQGFPTLKGRVALIARGDPLEGQSYHLKRVRKTARGYVLHSDNPDVEDQPAEPTDSVVAVLVNSISPEELAPRPGTRLRDDELADAFGLTGPPRPTWSRVDGHLFLLLQGEGSLVAPDRVPQFVAQRHPGETAFVLWRKDAEEPWRYLGVGRWEERDGAWSIPEVDLATWQALGHGGSAPRRLDPR